MTDLIQRLHAEAAASEELDPTDSSIAVMMEAASLLAKRGALNKELAEALETIRPICGAPHEFTLADGWKAQQKADTVLAKYNAHLDDDRSEAQVAAMIEGEERPHGRVP